MFQNYDEQKFETDMGHRDIDLIWHYRHDREASNLEKGCNVPIICNHGPMRQWNSRDFAFFPCSVLIYDTFFDTALQKSKHCDSHLLMKSNTLLTNSTGKMLLKWEQGNLAQLWPLLSLAPSGEWLKNDKYVTNWELPFLGIHCNYL